MLLWCRGFGEMSQCFLSFSVLESRVENCCFLFGLKCGALHRSGMRGDGHDSNFFFLSAL